METQNCISTPIPWYILSKSFYELNFNPTKILLCNTIYHFINSGYDVTPQSLLKEVKLNIKTIYTNLKLIQESLIFRKDNNCKEWISLFPTTKHCIARKGEISKNENFVIFYSSIPKTQIEIEVYLTVSKEQINQFKTIDDQEYYLITYQFQGVCDYSLELGLITIKATNPSKITLIKHLGFNINDQGQPYLIDKDSIIEELA